MKNEKGFTLIELLAVIVIMGILMAIAIPSINLIIMDARKDIYVNSVRTFINEAEKEVINSTFEIDDPDTTYYIHIANLVDDASNLGKSGFATWGDSYVVATMSLINEKVTNRYYFNGIDLAGWKIELVGRDKLKKSDVYQDSKKRIRFLPVGSRSKIVVYDKNGIKDESQKPYIATSEELAKKCYQYSKLANGTISIVGYNSSCGDEVAIPSMICDSEVTDISHWAFMNKGLMAVFIPNTIEKIGEGAFKSNSLTTVNVSDSVTVIEHNAFANNLLSKINLPSGLKIIGSGSFRNNHLVETIDKLVPNISTKIGTCAFCGNDFSSDESFMYKRKSSGGFDYSEIVGYMGNFSEFSNKNFIVPGTKNGIKLNRINYGSFNGMDLNGWSVVISNASVVDQWSFNSTGIVSVSLPDNLKNIGDAAFGNNNLSSVIIPSNVTYFGRIAFSNNPGLVKIVNKTGKSFNWKNIVGGTSEATFETGVIKTSHGDVVVTKE